MLEKRKVRQETGCGIGAENLGWTQMGEEVSDYYGWGETQNFQHPFWNQLGFGYNGLLHPLVPDCLNYKSDSSLPWVRGFICTSLYLGGKDACAGDSGGPMVTTDKEGDQWYLVGVVSWGEDCGKKDRYGVYSYIYPNKDWIQTVTGVRN